MIENSAIPYSIVRATQFFEFLPSVADAATDGSVVRFAPVLFQPVAEEMPSGGRQDLSGSTVERGS